MKRETESLICAAQEQALKTNAVKTPLITRTCPLYAGSPKRKLKLFSHIVSSRSVSAGNQYRKRNDKPVKKLYWLLSQKFEFECEDKWFSH